MVEHRTLNPLVVGSSPTALTRILAVALATISSTSCARWAQEPRFGSLTRDQRTFHFKHSIDLLEVSNGMRVALIHDARTNLATVDVRYDVGAAEDPRGKAGLAHLVEHLLFEVRATPDGPTLGDELGEIALYNNAYTMWDETHYTSTGPIEKLPELLAIEARRLTARCDQIDEATFQRERDVVLAETAQRDNATVEVQYAINAAVYGKDHPYARPVSSTEVATATRADACAFIAQHYAPSRVSVVISGPFDRSTIQKLVGSTFGPAARKVPPRTRLAPARASATASQHKAPIDKPTVLVVFPKPAWGSEDDVVFQVAAQLLRRRLAAIVEDRSEIVSSGVFHGGGMRAPTLIAALELKPGTDPEAAAQHVHAAVDSLTENVTPRAFGRMLGIMELELVARWDDIPARGNWIADFMQYSDHTWFMLRDMRLIEGTNWDQALVEVKHALAPQWSHVAYVSPTGAAATGDVSRALPAGSHDLVPWRSPVDPAVADRPLAVVKTAFASRVERYQLDNGLVVELAPDARSPIVDVRLVFPVGRAHEPADRRNLASAAAFLLDQDFEGYYEQAMVDKLTWATSLGTELSSDVSEATTTFYARGLAHWADWHVWYLSWLIDQGRYNKVHLETMHKLARAASADEDDEVDQDALALRARLFGADHPYAVPEPDAGAAYLKLEADDLEGWKRAHYRARGATLIVSGAFEVDRMKQVIRELYGPWSGDPPPALPQVPSVTPPQGPSYLAAEDDGEAQVTVTVGFGLGKVEVADRAARAVLREMLEDEVRIVREGMGASYGVHATTYGGVAGRALLVSGQIDEAKAGEAAKRILAAVERLRSDAASQREGFVRARRKLLAAAVARTGGAADVAGELEGLAAAGLPLDYPAQLAQRIAQLSPADVAAIAARDLAPERMVVQIRGKATAVTAAFATLGVTPTRP